MISQPADRRRWRPGMLRSRCWEQAKQQIDRWWPRNDDEKQHLLLLKLNIKRKTRAKFNSHIQDATICKENYTQQILSYERKQSSRLTNKTKKKRQTKRMLEKTKMKNIRRRLEIRERECNFERKKECEHERERECECECELKCACKMNSSCKCCCDCQEDCECYCEKGKRHEIVRKENDGHIQQQVVVELNINRTAAMILSNLNETSILRSTLTTTTPSPSSSSSSSIPISLPTSVAVKARASMYYTAIVLCLLLFSWSPSAIGFASASTSNNGNNRWTAERSNQTLGLPFDDLVAFGGTSVLAPPVGRLIDSIASPTSNTNNAKKLDYIVEFMRAHKLNVFCDLLTGDSPEASAVRDQLNGLPQFTLFVPTNEALLLMSSKLLADLRSNPNEARKFLLSHAVSELVSPRSPGTSQVHSLAGGTLWAVATNQSGKLELAVNGAGVVSAGSYALQEQQNASATYAIVHLLERSLYPTPELNLLELMRNRAPKMTNFILQDQELSTMLADLTGTDRLWTVLAPSDDAFSALTLSSSSSDLPLKRQLISDNQTFLANFLRSHLIEGIHLSAELAQVNKLRSLINSDLQFDTKRLQSRQLLLVNSIPIVESDLLAKNGALHLLARPLVEGSNLSDCKCPSGSNESSDRLSPTPKDQLEDQTGAIGFTGNELERDESAQQATSKLEQNKPVERVPRSGNLVARNNRDFYRPSTAPANLLLTPGVGQQSSLTQDLFELERYKVLNATSRQRMRELLRLPPAEGGIDSSAQRQTTSGSPSESQFVYDKPLASQQKSGSVSRGVSPSDNTTTWDDASAKLRTYSNLPTSLNTQTDQLTSSTDRQQRQLLKFQPEDARQPDPNSQVLVKQQQLLGKTAQPPGFTGCAFYDANCKRLLSKLVRLPTPLKQPSLSSDQQHLDVTFGETTEPTSIAELNRGALNSSIGSSSVQPRERLSVNSNGLLSSRLQAVARVSPLNQPLPPWSDEEKLVASWPRVQPDLTRLSSNPGSPLEFAPGLSRQLAAQQIQLANKSPIQQLQNLTLSSTLKNPQQQQQNPGSENAIFVSPNPVKVQSSPLSRNFSPFRPTPYSISPVTTHLPPMFQQSVRLTNFSTYDQFSDLLNLQNGSSVSDQFQPNQEPRTPKRVVLKTQITDSTGQQQVVPLGPVALRKQRLQQLNNADQLGKVPATINFPQQTTGDISITSARLTASQQQMATQASNQAPINQLTSPVAVNTQLTRSLPNQGINSELSTDFFQDRSIAEIMDDSGLRIDDSQVTFSRLKECLVEANLLSLLSQTGNSITIFLPTDSAFQRLVQQQQLLQQQRGFLASRSARLTDSGRLIPLIARRQGSSNSLALLDSSTSNLPVDQRLTLDCGSPQMRAILLDHLSARLITPKQLQQDTAITSLAGHQLLLSSVPSKKIVVVDGQPVIAATRAQNGMVYVVNKFLNLTQQVPNLVQLIQAQPNLTTFLSYLSFSGLSDRLRRETGPLTVLAPSNEAFDQLSSSSRQLINSDPAALMDVLRGHIVEGAQYGKLISMRNQLKTLNPDQIIEAKVIKPNFYLLDNQMTAMRFVGTTGNGVLNIIDRIIVPSWLRVPNSSSGNLRESGVRAVSGTPAVVNHLPVISSQPVRFDQAGARFNPSSDSFLLENSGEPTTQTSSPFPRTSPSTNLTGVNSSSSSSSSGQATSSNKQLRYTRNIQLIEKLSDLMQVNRFVKFLLNSRVAETLKPDMNYVILVPTDQAIEKLPKQIIDMLERDPERLADLVNYHVLDTTFEYINTIPDGSTLNTLNEKDILFNWHRNNTILTASGAVVMGGIQEDNIALLIVDRVLYPTPGDILQIVSKSPILSNFTSLLRNAGLEQQLSLPGPYTLFAPSDFAFNQLEAREFEFLQRNKETARRFLLRHLSQPTVFTSSIALSNLTLPSRVTSTSATNQQPLPTMTISNSLGEELTLRQRNDYFSVNDVNFSYADVAATNGVVHVIDGLL